MIPGGNDELLPQDLVFFMVREDHLAQLMRITGVEQETQHRVMIIGGALWGGDWLSCWGRPLM